MGMWIVVGVVFLGVLAAALVIDLRDGSLRSRVNRRGVREGKLSNQNKAALGGTFLGSDGGG